MEHESHATDTFTMHIASAPAVTATPTTTTKTTKTTRPSAVKKTSSTVRKTTTVKETTPSTTTTTTTTTPPKAAEFEAPNQYGYFPSAIEAARQRRETQTGFDSDVKLSKDAQRERFAQLCGKHPELQKCQENYVSPLRVKPSTQSVINGSVVRSDGIILVPGNKDDLVTWALDPAMSGDTLGLLVPTLFISIGAQLKQVAGVPEYVSGAVGVTTKLIATGLVALYWVPAFTSGA